MSSTLRTTTDLPRTICKDTINRSTVPLRRSKRIFQKTLALQVEPQKGVHVEKGEEDVSDEVGERPAKKPRLESTTRLFSETINSPLPPSDDFPESDDFSITVVDAEEPPRHHTSLSLVYTTMSTNTDSESSQGVFKFSSQPSYDTSETEVEESGNTSMEITSLRSSGALSPPQIFHGDNGRVMVRSSSSASQSIRKLPSLDDSWDASQEAGVTVTLPALVAFSVKNLEKKPVREPNVILRESRHMDRNVFRSLTPRLGHTNKALRRENAFVRAGAFSDPPEPEVEKQSCNIEPDCDAESEANASGDQSRLFDFSFQSVANTTFDTEVDGDEEISEGYEEPGVEPDHKEARREREINADDAIHASTPTRERNAPLPKPPAPSNPTRNLKRYRSSSDHALGSGDYIPIPEDDLPTIGQRLTEVEDRPVAHPRDEFELGRCLLAAQEAPSDGGSSPVTFTRPVTPSKLEEDKE